VKLTGAILVAFFLGESLHRVVLPQNALLQKATKLLTLPSLAAFTLVLVAWPTWYALAFDHQTFLQRINLPHRLPADSWRDVQQWIAENTPADAVFFVPPDTRAFRIYAKRSSVVDWKDGAPSVFSERYAKTWWERMTRLQGYENLGAQEWRELAARYRASFLVARANSPLQFPKPYDNGAFAVYLITNDGVSPH
jgi:hypothetical protein